MTLEIERIGDRGDGIAAGQDGPVYVPRTVPGDRVTARLGPPRGDGRVGELEAVVAPGPDRVEPPCPHFGRCGGCALQHWADPAIAAWKQDRINVALQRAGLDHAPIAPVATVAPATRRRAAFVAVRAARATVLGFHVRRGHDVVDVTGCAVLDPRIVAALPHLRAGLTPLLAPRERIGVVVTCLDEGLDVVLDRPAAPDLSTWEALAGLAATADLARLSWRSAPDGVAEPVVERRPAGVRMAGLFVPLPSGGFLQPSPDGEALLVEAVVAATGSVARVLDLFAGAGTFSLPLIAGGARVHAVDGDAALIRALSAAGAAAMLSGLTTEVRDLFRRPLVEAELKPYDAAVFDPPRAGAREQADALARSPIPVIAAVSCNPATFARDARRLVDGGYRLVRITPVDQFRWSPHVELVAVFRRP